MLKTVEAVRDDAVKLKLEFEAYLLQAVISALNERL